MLAWWRSAVSAFGRRTADAGSRRHRLPAGSAAILIVALAASGCSGGSGKSVAVSATTTSSTTGGAPSSQAFIQCMQSHGVAITSVRGLRGGTTPSSLPAGVTAPQFQQAFQACRSQLPTGGAGGQGFQNNPAFAAYRNCLMLHGVTLPQPGQRAGAGGQSTSTTAPGGGQGGGQGLGGLDRTNPTVAAALQACAALRPSGGPGGSTTTPTS
jgi:hypothetical protein